MWIPREVAGWFQISKDTVDSLREELAAVRAERDILKLQAIADRTTNDWLRVKVNGLEAERAGLLEKAYGIRVPVPELVRAPAPFDPSAFSFDHIDDELAKKLGMPIFNHQNDYTQ